MGDFFMEKIFTRKNKECFIVVSVILAVYLVMKFLSPLVAPFLIAFLFVAFLYPRLERLQNRIHIKKGIMAFFLILLVCVILISIIIWAFNLLCHKGMEIVGQVDVIEEQFAALLKVCCENLETRFGFDGTYIENFILEQVNIQIENLEINIMPKLMGGSLVYLKNITGFFGFFIVMIISALLLIKDYDKIINKATNCKELYCIFRIGRKVTEYIRTFIKAQLIIMAVISVMCGLTLWLTGINGGIVIGVITGIMDMLPFIGTGIILVPLSVVQLFTESYWKAGVCLLLYGACALTREILEPKLIGDKVGMWPITILFAVYVGIKLFGLMGIIKGPIGMVIIFETYRYLKETREE